MCHTPRSVSLYRCIRIDNVIRAGVVALVASAVVTVVPPAAAVQAHPVIDPAAFQQVELARGVDEMGEPMSMAILPDRSVLHTARDGTVRRTDAAGTTTVIGDIPVYHARRGGDAGHRGRPRLRHQPVHLPLLRSPAVDTGRRRARDRHRRDVGRLARGQPAVPVHAQQPTGRSTWPARGRSSTCRPTGASAATSAATSTSTRPATSICPQGTTPTRSTRAATRRSTSAPTATRRTTRSAPPPTPTTCAERSCGSR